MHYPELCPSPCLLVFSEVLGESDDLVSTVDAASVGRGGRGRPFVTSVCEAQEHCNNLGFLYTCGE